MRLEWKIITITGLLIWGCAEDMDPAERGSMKVKVNVGEDDDDEWEEDEWEDLDEGEAGEGEENQENKAIRLDLVKNYINLTWAYVDRPKKVQRDTLDDSRFFIRRVAVGLQEYLSRTAPYVLFEKPKDADYVQIMRCNSAHVENNAPGVDNYSVIQLQTGSGLSTAERNQAYRNNDYWVTLGSDVTKCQIVNLAVVTEDYLDTWATDGNYRYLLRACVAKSQFEGTAGQTSKSAVDR